MACITCVKILMVLLNMLLLLVGIALSVGGGLVLWGLPVFRSLLSSALSSLQSTLKSSGSTVTTDDFLNYVLGLIKGVGTPVFIVGVIIFAIAFIGLIGTCCSFRLLLIIYIILQGLLALALIILIIVYYAANAMIFSGINNQLKNTLQDYKGLISTNVETVLWNFLHYQFGCCGVTNGTDFDSVTWNRTYVLSSGQQIQTLYPYTCCVLKSDFTAQDSRCPQLFDVQTSNFDLGCGDKLKSFVDKYSPTVFGIIGGIAGFLVILLILAVCIIQDGNKIDPV